MVETKEKAAGANEGVSLFEHNKRAYESAVSMLADTGKAAVIHPTGTGKSFIGFKLCADNPQKTVCWLSPSAYIFRTQVENLRAASGSVPGNVKFFTYARLMHMGKDEIAGIQPDYIILDEFHRCGARMWGAGVQGLLDRYPDVPVLGLSATNIRYLDNRRDMADEIFDGHIASEMTLGEAVVRGILNPPKYVLAAYSCQGSLEKYEQRIRQAKNKAVREEAGKLLETLRRALDKADGLDEIFCRHMDPCGKYIIFCSSAGHMREMMGKAHEWFGKVDASPHVYSAYFGDPGSSRAFTAFKRDTSSHLRLLYCIDMLNEGIHVEGVSGVILLRPTVSPTIYKQQIGRALSASSRTGAVIFDIVFNIEGLSSIDAVREEMQDAVRCFQFMGDGKEVVNGHFQVVDEVQDCIALFGRLNETLSASWEMMYAEAEKYFQVNEDLDVPSRYVTENGLALGAWVKTQRRVYEGSARGCLTDGRIERLNAIGMRWTGARDAQWEQCLAAAKAYYSEHGNLLVPTGDGLYHGVRLGRWLSRLRAGRKAHGLDGYLTPERARELDGLGMVWDVGQYQWEEKFSAAERYFGQHGNLDVPARYIDEKGVRLGAWIRSLREARKNPGGRRKGLTEEEIGKLDGIGMRWEPEPRKTWTQYYEAACKYRKEHGNLDVPRTYVTDSGIALGDWLRRQRGSHGKSLGRDKAEKLEAIGMVWETPDPWEEKFAIARRYYEGHGGLEMPGDTVVEGVWLCRWLTEQKARLNGRTSRKNRKMKELTPEQAGKLASIGIHGLPSRDTQWARHYESAKHFYEEHGHLRVPRRYETESGERLGAWVQQQKEKYRKGKLTTGQVGKLDEIGMIWTLTVQGQNSDTLAQARLGA